MSTADCYLIAMKERYCRMRSTTRLQWWYSMHNAHTQRIGSLWRTPRLKIVRNVCGTAPDNMRKKIKFKSI